jgi:hypothetical protein
MPHLRSGNTRRSRKGPSGRVALEAVADTRAAMYARNRARAKARGLARFLVLVRGEAFGLYGSGKA